MPSDTQGFQANLLTHGDPEKSWLKTLCNTPKDHRTSNFNSDQDDGDHDSIVSLKHTGVQQSHRHEPPRQTLQSLAQCYVVQPLYVEVSKDT